MTIEEAGQVILEGKAFVDCGACKGEGRHLIETRTDIAKNQLPIETEVYQHCSLCTGAGKVLNLDYSNACALLGKEVPEAPIRPTRHVHALPPPQRMQFPVFPQVKPW